MKQINLEEILKSKINEAIGSTTILNEFEFNIKKDSAILEAMKEACKQVLELASENAKLKCTNIVHPKGYPWFMHNPNGTIENGDLMIVVNKNSILNTINQVK